MNAARSPGRDEVAYPLTHGHRQDAGPWTTADESPWDAEPFHVLSICQVQGQGATSMASDILAELHLVTGENPDAFAATRNRHVPLLLVRGRLDDGVGEQDVIHRFAL